MSYVRGMGEIILEFLKYAVQALVEFIVITTGRTTIWLISLGRVQFERSRHPPAYGEQPPIVVGPISVAIVGLLVWGAIILAAAVILAHLS